MEKDRAYAVRNLQDVTGRDAPIAARADFFKYVKSEHSEENLEFIKAVDAVDLLEENSSVESLEQVVNNFIVQDAPRQVNLPTDKRVAVEAALEAFRIAATSEEVGVGDAKPHARGKLVTALQDSRTEVEKLLTNDALSRFKNLAPARPSSQAPRPHSSDNVNPAELASAKQTFINANLDEVESAALAFARYQSLFLQSGRPAADLSKDDAVEAKRLSAVTAASSVVKALVDSGDVDHSTFWRYRQALSALGAAQHVLANIDTAVVGSADATGGEKPDYRHDDPSDGDSTPRRKLRFSLNDDDLSPRASDDDSRSSMSSSAGQKPPPLPSTPVPGLSSPRGPLDMGAASKAALANSPRRPGAFSPASPRDSKPGSAALRRVPDELNGALYALAAPLASNIDTSVQKAERSTRNLGPLLYPATAIKQWAEFRKERSDEVAMKEGVESVVSGMSSEQLKTLRTAIQNHDANAKIAVMVTVLNAVDAQLRALATRALQPHVDHINDGTFQLRQSIKKAQGILAEHGLGHIRSLDFLRDTIQNSGDIELLKAMISNLSGEELRELRGQEDQWQQPLAKNISEELNNREQASRTGFDAAMRDLESITSGTDPKRFLAEALRASAHLERLAELEVEQNGDALAAALLTFVNGAETAGSLSESELSALRAICARRNVALPENLLWHGPREEVVLGVASTSLESAIQKFLEPSRTSQPRTSLDGIVYSKSMIDEHREGKTLYFVPRMAVSPEALDARARWEAGQVQTGSLRPAMERLKTQTSGVQVSVFTQLAQQQALKPVEDFLKSEASFLKQKDRDGSAGGRLAGGTEEFKITALPGEDGVLRIKYDFSITKPKAFFDSLAEQSDSLDPSSYAHISWEVVINRAGKPSLATPVTYDYMIQRS